MKFINRNSLRRFTLLLMVFATAWTYLWFPDYTQKKHMQAQADQLRADIKELTSQLEYNRDRIALLKDDDVTIEGEIRRNLRWVRPGDLPAEIGL